jgi:predicted membrane protein
MEKRISGKLVAGGLIILAGVLALLFNLGVLPVAWEAVVFSWQMLFVVIGLIHFLYRHYLGGLVWVTIGFVFMLTLLSPIFGFNYPIINQLIWPVAFIILGLMLVFTHSKRHHCRSRRAMWNRHHNQVSCEKHEDGRIDYNVIMSGVEEIFLHPIFRGGEINTIMGGVKLDLRRTSLPEGITTLKIDSIAGGVTLYVPQNWTIELKTEATLGGFVDKRTVNGEDETKKLIIIANLMMGGGEIKC